MYMQLAPVELGTEGNSGIPLKTLANKPGPEHRILPSAVEVYTSRSCEVRMECRYVVLKPSQIVQSGGLPVFPYLLFLIPIRYIHTHTQ